MNLTIGFVDPTINRNGYKFFEKVQNDLELSKLIENVRIICVVALFESSIPFTLALNKLAPIAGIIPKESTLKHRPEILTAKMYKGESWPVKIFFHKFSYRKTGLLCASTYLIFPNIYLFK